MSASSAVLSVNNIEVIYNHVILVLKGVSLEVPEGGIVALLGANGAGKTTTLKSVSNLLRSERGEVTKGTIEFRGERIEKLTPTDLVKRGVIQVMEGRHCFEHLTVEENLLTGSYTRTDGRPRIPLPASSCDRFVSNYVLDLLSGQDVLRTLEQAWRVLRPDGLLCLTSLTYGTTVASKLTIAAWLAVHSLRPSLVGGCRPIVLTDFLGPASWEVLYSNTVVSYGVPSQVLIARPRVHSQDGERADDSAGTNIPEESKDEDRGHREP